MAIRLSDYLGAGSTGRRRLVLVGLLASLAVGLVVAVAPVGIWKLAGATLIFVPLTVLMKLIVENSHALVRVTTRERALSAEVGRLEQRDEAARQQIDSVRERLSSIVSAQRAAQAHVDSRMVAIAADVEQDRLTQLDVNERTHDGLRSLERDLSSVEKRTTYAAGELDRLQARTDRLKESMMGRLESLKETADERHRENGRRIERERRSRHLATAARDSSGQWPERVLLQMTINRTGSTRLFDILRTHPDVYVEPLDFIWSSLGLTGRRYPVGLSDPPKAVTSIVSQGEIGVGIRSMRPPMPGMADTPVGSIAIEKAHPQFFGFDVKKFLANVDAVTQRHSVQIDVIYQIRSPLDIMWSMAEYKHRDPTWHGDLTVAGVPALVRSEFEALETLVDAWPGLVVDYGEMSESSQTMLQLSHEIAPNSPRVDRERWLELAFARTARSAIAQTEFVGERSERTASGPDGEWLKSETDLATCRSIYERLIASRTS